MCIRDRSYLAGSSGSVSSRLREKTDVHHASAVVVRPDSERLHDLQSGKLHGVPTSGRNRSSGSPSTKDYSYDAVNFSYCRAPARYKNQLEEE